MRYWTCKCGERLPRIKQKCVCGKARPVRKTNAQKALSEPYEWWTEKYGTTCNICGRSPSARRRLDRDHCHASLKDRGLLCQKCNRALTPTVTRDWMVAAISYLDRFEERAA